MFCRRPCKSLVKGEKDSPDARFRRSAHCRTCQNLQLTRVPLGGGSCLRRTGHPFAVSGPEGPSQKIESVFSASPEKFEESLWSLISIAQSATCRTWQPARCVIPICFFFLRRRFLGRRSLVIFCRHEVPCSPRSTARRYATIFRATASVARQVSQRLCNGQLGSNCCKL